MKRVPPTVMSGEQGAPRGLDRRTLLRASVLAGGASVSLAAADSTADLTAAARGSSPQLGTHRRTEAVARARELGLRAPSAVRR